MNKYLEIVIIFALLSTVLVSLKLAYGQNLIDNMDNIVTQMIADCAIQAGTGIVNTYTILCTSFMNDTDKVCQQQYHSYCFGTAWKDFDLTKHVK